MKATTRIKALAVFAVAVMLLANVTIMTFPNSTDADDKETLVYVSLGDSMVNGMGMPDYYPEGKYNYYGFELNVGSTYPSLLSKYFESQGYSVDYRQLAVTSTRSMDLRALLDDEFSGDFETVSKVFPDYYIGQFDNNGALKNFNVPGYSKNFTGLQQYYRDSIAAADVITYQMHTDFSDTFQRFIDAFASKESPDFQFEVFCDPEMVEMMQSAYEFIMGHLEKILEVYGIDPESIIDTINFATDFAEALAYTITMYCTSFDNNMRYIFDSNPNAKVIVLDSYSSVEDLNIIIGGNTVSVGDFYEYVLDYCNLYAEYISPYAALTYHVNVEGSDILLFNEEFYETPQSLTVASKNAVAAVLLENMPKTAEQVKVLGEDSTDVINPKGYIVYDMFDGESKLLTKFLGYVFQSKTLDYDVLKEIGDLDEIKKILEPKVLTTMGMILMGECTISYSETSGCIIRDSEKTVTFNINELTLMYIWLVLMSSSKVLAHPSTLGHAAQCEAVVSVIEDRKVLDRPSGYPAFMDPDVATTVDEALKQYRDISIKTITDELHDIVAKLDDSWAEVVDAQIAEYIQAAYDEIKSVHDNWNTVKQEIIDELEKMEGYIPGIKALVEFLEQEQFSAKVLAKLQEILDDWDQIVDDSGIYQASDAIHGYITHLNQYWDDIMSKIASGEMANEIYQGLLEDVFNYLDSIDVDADLANIVKELGDMADKLDSITEEDVAAQVEQVIADIDSFYADHRDQIEAVVKLILGIIKDIIGQILDGDDSKATVDAFNENYAALGAQLAIRYDLRAAEMQAWVDDVAEYADSFSDSPKFNIKILQTEISDFRADVSAFVSDNGSAAVKEYLNKIIDDAEALSAKFITSLSGVLDDVSSAMDDAASQTSAEAKASVDAALEKVKEAVLKVEEVSKFLRTVAQDPDAYIHIDTIRAKLADIVKSDYDGAVADAKVSAKDLYDAVKSMYDDLEPQLPAWVAEYLQAAMAEIKEAYDAFETYDFAALKTKVLAIIADTSIEDCISKNFKAVAAQIEDAAAQIDKCLVSDAKEEIIAQIEDAAVQISIAASSVRELSGLVEKSAVPVNEALEKVRAYINSLLAGEPGELDAILADLDSAIADVRPAVPADTQEVLDMISTAAPKYVQNVKAAAAPAGDDMYAAQFSNYYRAMIKQYAGKLESYSEALTHYSFAPELEKVLLAIVDRLETASLSVQDDAVSTLTEIAAQIDKEADRIQDDLNAGYVEKIIEEIHQYVIEAYEVSDFLAKIAADPEEYTHIIAIKDRIVSLIDTAYLDDETVAQIKAEVKELYDEVQAFYDQYKEDIPAWIADDIAEAMEELAKMYDEFESYDFEELKVKLVDAVNDYALDLQKYVVSEFTDAAAAVKQIVDNVDKYVTSEELKAEIIAEAEQAIRALRALGANINDEAHQISLIDVHAAMDDLREEIINAFEIDKDDLQKLLRAFGSKLALINEYIGIQDVTVLGSLGVVLKDFMNISRVFDTTDIDDLIPMIEGMMDDYDAFEDTYRAYYLDLTINNFALMLNDFWGYVNSQEFKDFKSAWYDRVTVNIMQVKLSMQIICADIIEQIKKVKEEIREELEAIMEIQPEDVMAKIDALVEQIEQSIRDEEGNISSVVLYVAAIASQELRDIAAVIGDYDTTAINELIEKLKEDVKSAETAIDFRPYFEKIGEFVETIHEIRIDITDNGINSYIAQFIDAVKDKEAEEQQALIDQFKAVVKSDEFQQMVAELDEFLTLIESGGFVLTGQLNEMVKQMLAVYDSTYVHFDTDIAPALIMLGECADDPVMLKDAYLDLLDALLVDVPQEEADEIIAAFLESYDADIDLYTTFAVMAPQLCLSIYEMYEKTDVVMDFLRSYTSYTITWIGLDGKIDQIDEVVRYGVVPEYHGYVPAPVYTKDKVYEYVWEPSVGGACYDATYTLTYEVNDRLYAVNWVVSSDETHTTYSKYGETAAYDYEAWGIPTKTDGTKLYKFIGWNTNPNARTALSVLPAITGEGVTLYAIFELLDVHYLTIHYVDQYGEKLIDDYVGLYKKGETFIVISPEIPDYQMTKKYVYGIMGDSDLEYSIKYLLKVPALA